MSTLRPLSLIYNEKSGFHAANKESVYEQIMTIFTQHDFEIQVFELSVEDNFDDFMQQVLLRHHGDNHGVVVAAGGDGTLNAVASKLKYTDIPMGILPLGTFNYVARVLNIPQDLLQAAEVIATGTPKNVHLGTINDRIYLNNASLGLYPLFIQKREQYNQRVGRHTLNAYTSGLDVLIRDHKELKLSLTIDGQVYPVKTSLVFFGNNKLQLQEMNLNIAECAEEGHVAGIVVAKSDKLSLFRMLFQLIKGDLEHAKDVYSFAADQVKVDSKSKTLTVAVDGEIEELRTPLTLAVAKNALSIMVPADATSSV